jgi:hypothetical protein
VNDRNDPGRDERWPTPDEQAEMARLGATAPVVLGPEQDDPVHTNLGPNFTPTPLGYQVREVIVGDDGEQGVLIALTTVIGQIGVILRPEEAQEFGRALIRYCSGLTVINQ